MIELAIAEAHQGLPFKLQPLTIVSYAVEHDGVLDLSTASTCAAAGVAFDDLRCAWELIAFNGGTPPSWTLADRLIGRRRGRRHRAIVRPRCR